jgi:shikimate kinase
MGMKHCGKSTHGELFAKRVNKPFADLDDLIEQRFVIERDEIKTCREIYREYGKDVFQEFELKALNSVVQCGSLGVVALGGGIASNEDAVKLLDEYGYNVYIEEKPEILFSRIKYKGLPPFLETEDPYATFLDLYSERTVVYQKLADVVIQPEGRPKGAVARMIIEKIGDFE